MKTETLSGDLRFDNKLIQRFISRAVSEPERDIFVFLDRHLNERDRLSYRNLVESAAHISKVISERKPTGNVGLMLSQDNLFVKTLLAVFFSGEVAVPVPPPNGRDISRTLSILNHAGVSVLVVSRYLYNKYAVLVEKVTELGVQVLVIDDHYPQLNPDLSFIQPGSNTALVQYTSGSTSNPKGVRISYDNILRNVELIGQEFELNDSDVGVSWLPFYHDMGLIGHIIVPLALGITNYFLSPFAFAAQPLVWLKAISKYSASVSGGPSFSYDMCARRLSDKDIDSLDLSSWRVAYCGSERISYKALSRFSERFSRASFDSQNYVCCYGMAESTLLVSAKRGLTARQYSQTSDHVVSVGLVKDGSVQIVAQGGSQALGEGDLGEVCINTPSLFRGYFGNDTDHSSFFLAANNGTYFRTKDIGFILCNELHIVGRSDFALIANGTNYFPEDVEIRVSEYFDRIRKRPRAVALTDISAEAFTLIVEKIGGLSSEKLSDVAAQLAYDLRSEGYPVSQVTWIEKGKIPHTSSGKPRRLECQALVKGAVNKDDPK